ncbi:MAG TPA: HD domain-containing protein [Tepidisphaeraceae bacterium]|nr:HD domain-containing protein [Tepidisphaeraceae bacterium]
MPEKIVRDPVHDVIAFRTERAGDALLFALLNAAEFQRLRRIRQLGMASLAYPSAEHSRYSHSLGVMEAARKMLAQLGQSIKIEPADELACVAASLLHDVGHGPFSHVFERVSGIEHEKLTRRIIEDPGSDVHQILANHDPSLPGRVVDLLNHHGPSPLFCDILSSQLDADRLDYLLRDNLMTGSRYGDYDLGWLLHSLTTDESSGRLAVTWKGVSAVEAYLQSRYHMYRNVYFHKVVRAAEGMVKLALQRARRLMVQDRLQWPPRDHAVSKALTGQRLTIEEYTDLDDVSVLHCFKTWATADDAPLAELCRGLLYRRLFKTLDITHLCESDANAAFLRAQSAVAAAGGDPAYHLFYDEPSDTPYEVYQQDSCGPSGEILVRDPTGRLTPFTALSPLPAALNRQLMFRRIHVAAQWRDVVRKSLGLS